MLQDVEELDTVPDDQVKWLEAEAFWATIKPEEPNAPEPEHEMAWWSDGMYDWWHDGDEWCTYAGNGVFPFSEMKPWMDVDDILAVDATAGKEAQDLLAAFESKVRTFKEARDYVHQKGQSRGYYPVRARGRAAVSPRKGVPSHRPLQHSQESVKEKGWGAPTAAKGQEHQDTSDASSAATSPMTGAAALGVVHPAPRHPAHPSPSALWTSACT